MPLALYPLQQHKMAWLTSGRCLSLASLSQSAKGESADNRTRLLHGQGWLQTGQGPQTPVPSVESSPKEAPCHEGQIPRDTPASLGPRASCPSFCSSRTQGWAFASHHPRLQVPLTLDCRRQRSLVKRQTQPHLTPRAARSGQSLGERMTSTASLGPQPGTLHPQRREMVSKGPSALALPPL